MAKKVSDGEVDGRRRLVFFGPEAEFFVVDDVKYDWSNPTGLKLDQVELPTTPAVAGR